MLNVGLLFHSAKNDNLGVGALTVAQVEILRRIAGERDVDLHITVLDGNDPRPPYLSGPDVTVLPLRPMRQPLHLYRVLRELDLVLDIGGGDSFADIYGWKRFTRMMAQKALVHAAGRPLVLSPQTVGPFASRVRARIALWSIRRAAVVTTRDAMSTAALRAMGFHGPVIEASDVALRLPFDTPPTRASGSPVRVGINVSGLLMSGGYTRANMFGLQMDYRQLMRDLITGFLHHPDGCEVHLVPHVITWGGGGVEDDRKASVDLAQAFPQVRVAPSFATPCEAKSYIAGLDFFLGARMHACIAAFSSGVPVVPMAYSRKFAGLFGALGYDHTVDCTSDPADTILTRVMAAYDDRATLAQEVQVAMGRGLEKLGAYEAALGDLMVEQAHARD